MQLKIVYSPKRTVVDALELYLRQVRVSAVVYLEQLRIERGGRL